MLLLFRLRVRPGPYLLQPPGDLKLAFVARAIGQGPFQRLKKIGVNQEFRQPLLNIVPYVGRGGHYFAGKLPAVVNHVH